MAKRERRTRPGRVEERPVLCPGFTVRVSGARGEGEGGGIVRCWKRWRGWCDVRLGEGEESGSGRISVKGHLHLVTPPPVPSLCFASPSRGGRTRRESRALSAYTGIRHRPACGGRGRKRGRRVTYARQFRLSLSLGLRRRNVDAWCCDISRPSNSRKSATLAA